MTRRKAIEVRAANWSGEQGAVPDSGLVATPGERMWGVLYDVDDAEVEQLDAFLAGDDDGYVRRSLWVLDDAGEQRRAEAYFPSSPAGPFSPSLQYLEIMVAGAKEHDLPGDYVERFERLLQPGVV